jgi:peptide-methionine (S)-S-oxide reductase
MFTFKRKLEMPAAADALPGRATPIPTARQHFVNGHPLKGQGNRVKKFVTTG